jgi:hypothetical protein
MCDAAQTNGQAFPNFVTFAIERTNGVTKMLSRKILLLAVAAIGLSAGLTTTASASRFRMLSIDHTQGPFPVMHDNGVPDGRICKIFFKEVFDPWTEDFVVRKVKHCI